MRNATLKRIVTLLAGTMLTMSSLSAQDAKPDPNVEAAKSALSILDQTAGWGELFNGKDLSGWTGDTKGYFAKDGNLVCEKGGKNLFTEKEYSDFAFRFEFKLQESGNNGIGIRVPQGGHASGSGMEIQILDHFGKKYAGEADMGGGKTQKLSWLKPWQYHGSIYGIVPSKTGYLKPVGEWNSETIIAIEDHIMVILNGAVIVDAHLDDVTPIGGGARAGMKNKSGHISLAGHSDHVEFRNLAVAEYAASPTSPDSSVDNTPPAGFMSMFNGKDLTGWKGLANGKAPVRRVLKGDDLAKAQTAADKTMNEHWSVIDGVLTYDGKGQSLCTATDYGDFEFYIDWKIPPGADSGIYLRGTPQVQIWDPWDPRVKDGAPDPANSEEWVKQYANGRNLGSGGLWNNRRWRNAPTTLADKKPGEWNTFLIRMVGDKVTIWLNGKLIVNRVALENYWDRTGVIPLVRADQIELQHHGSELFFKNMYIRDLPY
jgi:hypothetical protein